ncbi:NAD(P)H-dependent oxidoreductase [Myxococcus stipitatus]|uniref:NAD(P)H-dependent oxidoreductase n=1 Tax=Myxococcus stipitatus TaxID=83455 RepID=UPI001F490735|nr:NAD(P)H-dependent oxidoreductase [Myxococcus stipitatus]MCE9673375.1 NAD(P)H-dependent oxidoreductase [Myxococcus stipitatus]
MHALIVVAHPNPGSLTHAVGHAISAGLAEAPGAHRGEFADLAAEGFDPRFTQDDIAVHLEGATPTADVLAEQARIARADALVLVYPVYWWSMPALLKGWIDRVFVNGWAYGTGADGKVEKRLRHMRVHLVALGGADQRTYARHGYFGAMKTQIDHGIFGYCGARVVRSELLLVEHGEDGAPQLEQARDLGRSLFAREDPVRDLAG